MVFRPTARGNPAADDDLALIRICCHPADDRFEWAFETLFRRYRDRVFSIAYRMTGRTNDALDIVQESFAVLFRKIASFREDSQFSTWLFRIVVNCTIDHQRHEQSKRSRISSSLSTLDSGAEPMDPDDGPDGRAENAELSRHIQNAIQKLSPKLSSILVLRYQQGLSYEELAQALGISLGTVKSRLARGHLALENRLAGSLESHGVRAKTAGPPQSHDQGVA